MQQLKRASILSAKSCAAEVLEAIPGILQFIRAQMLSKQTYELSLPQFRVLMLLYRSPGASLSSVAGFLGLSLPAASRLVEGMVQKGYLSRQTLASNRRMVSLELSSAGRRAAYVAQRTTARRLTKLLSSLPAHECAAIQHSLRILSSTVQAASEGKRALRVER